MNFQQIVILVATIMGWVLVLGSLGFGVVIIAKIYASRDKVAAAERKRLEEVARKAKKAAKKGETVEPEAEKPKVEAKKKVEKPKAPTLPPRPKMNKQAMKGFQAPKRDDVVRNLASSIDASEMRPGASFLEDELDEFDLARKQVEEKDNPSSSTSNGFPPPPPRL